MTRSIHSRMRTVPVAASSETALLRRKIRKLGQEIGELRHQINNMRGAIKKKENRINTLQEKLRAIAGTDIEITDHALVRFLERVKGVNIEDVINEILTEDVREQVDMLGGSGRFPIPGGFHLVIENKKIISIVPIGG